jgi:hypothetical protein
MPVQLSACPRMMRLVLAGCEAKCISCQGPSGFCFCFRVLDIGVAQVTTVSAGGAVTSHTRIHDMVVHEEYRQHGSQLLLNDIGKVVGRLPARVALQMSYGT